MQLLSEELRDIMLNHPQASLQADFTVYIDPINDSRGQPTNALAAVKPAVVTIKRPALEITGRYLRNCFNSLSDGQPGQKIRTAELFCSLLAEQQAMANYSASEAPYKFMYADWMPQLIKSSLAHNLADDDWVVRADTIAAMKYLPLDYELTTALADNLRGNCWPVRLMALYILAQNRSSDFSKVLDWTAGNDEEKIVRDMAISLGAAKPAGSAGEKPSAK